MERIPKTRWPAKVHDLQAFLQENQQAIDLRACVGLVDPKLLGGDRPRRGPERHGRSALKNTHNPIQYLDAADSRHSRCSA